MQPEMQEIENKVITLKQKGHVLKEKSLLLISRTWRYYFMEYPKDRPGIIGYCSLKKWFFQSPMLSFQNSLEEV